MSKFDIKNFLTENKLTEQSKRLDEAKMVKFEFDSKRDYQDALRALYDEGWHEQGTGIPTDMQTKNNMTYDSDDHYRSIVITDKKNAIRNAEKIFSKHNINYSTSEKKSSGFRPHDHGGYLS